MGAQHGTNTPFLLTDGPLGVGLVGPLDRHVLHVGLGVVLQVVSHAHAVVLVDLVGDLHRAAALHDVLVLDVVGGVAEVSVGAERGRRKQRKRKGRERKEEEEAESNGVGEKKKSVKNHPKGHPTCTSAQSSASDQHKAMVAGHAWRGAPRSEGRAGTEQRKAYASLFFFSPSPSKKEKIAKQRNNTADPRAFPSTH